jgi:hypothetical protein
MTDTPSATCPSPLPAPAYLGDGVYASFDGYRIWLSVNHHTNDVVALEPQVFYALVRYGGSIFAPARKD